jgi:two-component system sensor histidine kinase HydH
MTRAEELFRQNRDSVFERTSRMFAVLMVIQWVAAIGIAIAISPYAWEGRARAVHNHVWAALLLGGAISSLPIYLCRTAPAAPVTRYTVAIGQMMWSALLIHLTGGRIETHFHVFGSLAFLAFYRDWKVLLPATIVVATDHLARQMLWPESVFGLSNPEWWRFLEHAFWVVYEDTVLIAACLLATDEMRRVARAHADVEATQSQLVRSEKLAAVGQLAASVGHELRNPLAAVRNANVYIGKKVKASGVDPKVIQFVDLIERELDACGKIIGDLLDFARERPLVTAPIALHALVDEAIAVLPATEIEIRNRVDPKLPLAEIDREQFRQVILNLMQNAVEAMETRGSGKVTIEASRTAEGSWRLVIEDDGPGMPPDTVTKIFEPLFTTKVKGTGLGLAIVAGIVKRHGGVIRCESRLGRGTEFIAEWPAKASPLQSQPPVAAVAVPAAATASAEAHP